MTLPTFVAGSQAHAADLNTVVSVLATAVQPGVDVSTNTALLASGETALTLKQMLTAFGGVPVSAFGAVGDGLTDDGPAFQAAGNWIIANGGGKVFLQGKSYVIYTACSFSGFVHFEGVGYALNALSTSSTPGTGTWLLLTNTSSTPFTWTGNATQGSSGMRKLGFYQPGHPAPGTGWAPTSYPPAIALTNTNGETYFEELMFLAINKGFNILNSPKHNLRRIKGQFFTYGVYADENYDVSFYDDWHIWLFWSQDLNVQEWQTSNGDLFYMLRNDGPMFGKIFALGYRSLLRCGQSSYGVLNDAFVQFLYADSCGFAVYVDSSITGTAGPASFAIDQWYSGAEQGGGFINPSTGLQIDGQAVCKLGTVKIIFTNDSAIRLTSTTLPSYVSINSLEVQTINQAGITQLTLNAASVTASGQPPHEIVIANPIRYSNIGTTPYLIATSNAIIRVPEVNYQYNYEAFNGYTFTFQQYQELYLENNATTEVASLIINLPPNPTDGMEVTVYTSSDVQSAYWHAPSGVRLIGAPANMTAYSPVVFKYLGAASGSSSLTWWCKNSFTQPSAINKPLQLGTFAIGALPSASAYVGSLITVSGASSPPALAIASSDSANWRWILNGNICS
jgi:hypothetical protein